MYIYVYIYAGHLGLLGAGVLHAVAGPRPRGALHNFICM